MRNLLILLTFPLGNGLFAAGLGLIFQSRQVMWNALFPVHWFASLFVASEPALPAVTMMLYMTGFFATIFLLLRRAQYM